MAEDGPSVVGHAILLAVLDANREHAGITVVPASVTSLLFIISTICMTACSSAGGKSPLTRPLTMHVSTRMEGTEAVRLSMMSGNLAEAFPKEFAAPVWLPLVAGRCRRVGQSKVDEARSGSMTSCSRSCVSVPQSGALTN